MLDLFLLRELFRRYKSLWLRCALPLILGLWICEAVCGTAAGDALKGFLSVIPGMTGNLGAPEDASPVTYLGTCMYGAIFLMIPAVYLLLLAARMAAGQWEDGTMAALYAAIGNRVPVLLTEGYWTAVSLLAMLLCTSLAGLLGAALLGESLEAAQFLLLNIGIFCFQLLMGGIFFLLAALLKNGRAVTAAGGAVLAAGYFLYALQDLGGGLSVLGRVSVFSVYRPDMLLAGNPLLYLTLPAAAAAGGALFAAAGFLLSGADIPA